MSVRDISERTAELENELDHAAVLAVCAIGYPDRAAKIAHREEVGERLHALRNGGAHA